MTFRQIALGFTISFFFFFSGSIAQITRGGNPRSSQKIVASDDVPEVFLPEINVEKLLAEDAERRKLGKEFDRRFGFTFDVAFTPQNSGVWKELPNGDRIWQLKIKAKDAFSINLTFHQYFLPPGADLFLIGKKNRIGALTSDNNQSDEKLGTGLIGGDEVLLEYFEPLFVRGLGKLEISKATRAYKDPFSVQGWGQSGACNMNVNCPRGLPWQNQKRAVARIIDNGDACTGALVNNTLQDGKPYFLTANHCFNNATSTWVFSFNWEAPGCTNPSTAIPETQTISGSTVKARASASDFLLLELSSKPPASYNVYYAGWNAGKTAALNTTIIHHPSGDIKKITFDEQPPLTWGYGIGNPNDTTHWRTVNYEYGTTTEGGSSGSPIFDHNQRIVGQLHGGPASCTNIDSDYYGKFSLSWYLGTTPASRLKDWLDPLNTGALALDGMDPGCRKINVRLPFRQNLDTVAGLLPYLWKVKNPDNDSTFRLVSGGFPSGSGKALVIRAENAIQVGRADSLLMAPVSVAGYKNLKFGFRRAYRRFSASSSDQLQLLVSRNCGNSFSLLNTWTGPDLLTVSQTGISAPFAPVDTGQFASAWVNLDSTFNRADQLVFAFRFVSGNAGTLWLDEFQILGDSAGNRPVARFFSSATGGCPGTFIQFIDSSMNNPTGRIWRFEGGNPAVSTLSNPLVGYSSTGVFKVSLLVTNPEGADSLITNGYITIFDVGTAQTPFNQPFASSGAFPPAGYFLLNPDNNRSWEINAAVNAPGSTGGSLMFDNYANPNVTGQKDWLLFPRISTAGKSKLRLKFSYAYKFYQGFGGVAPDTFTIGYSSQCGGTRKPLWRRGGTQLATAGSQSSNYTPAAGDWRILSLNLDSLLVYPEVSVSFENLFGYGNRLFIDDVQIDTANNCPDAPTVSVNDDSLCIGNQLILTMDSIPGATYAWSGPANFNSSARIATRNLTTTTQSGIYQGTVIKNGCSSAAVVLPVLVSAVPAVPVITVTGNTLTGPPNQAAYLWIFNGDTLSANTSTLEITASGTYILVVFNGGGCFRASAPRNVIYNGLSEKSAGGLPIVYPNPVEGRFTVSGLSGSEKISITDMQGKVIFAELPAAAQKKGWDISHLPSGVYHLQIRSDKQVFHSCILKK
jgi:PKD repeat protein